MEGKNEEEIELGWPPLESDPSIFNQYFHSLGLKKDIKFKEMIALVDYKEFLIISGPLLGVILNYSREENATKIEYPEKKDTPYFMKQTEVLDDACGLIASLHCFGNAKKGKLEFEPGSILDNYFKKSRSLSPLDRALLLEKDNSFKKAHKSFAQKGQTDVKEQVNKGFVGHYVCFMNIDGKLVRFDGLKDAPTVIEENIDDSNFLDKTAEHILSLINNKQIKEQVSVMIVADPDSQVVDLLEEE